MAMALKFVTLFISLRLQMERLRGAYACRPVRVAFTDDSARGPAKTPRRAVFPDFTRFPELVRPFFVQIVATGLNAKAEEHDFKGLNETLESDLRSVWDINYPQLPQNSRTAFMTASPQRTPFFLRKGGPGEEGLCDTWHGGLSQRATRIDAPTHSNAASLRTTRSFLS